MQKVLAWIFLPTSVLILLGIVIWALFGYPSDTESIKTGFSEKFVNKLAERYELQIPSDAVFIRGHYEHTLQDPSVNINFKIPEDELKKLFINNWEPGWPSSNPNKYFETFEYQKMMFTGYCNIRVYL